MLKLRWMPQGRHHLEGNSKARATAEASSSPATARRSRSISSTAICFRRNEAEPMRDVFVTLAPVQPGGLE